MKKLQVPLIVLVLFAVIYGMNSVADMRQKKAEELTKQAEQAKKSAELAALAKKPPVEGGHGHGDKIAFALPKSTGVPTAPVKVEIFINNTNSCHEGSVKPMQNMGKVYGSLARVEWYGTTDPKVSARADKLKLGCEAGLVINGKIEREVDRNGGKVLLSFRGPAGDKYKMEDVYKAINSELRAKGKTPPAAAIAAEKAISTAAPKH
ncbi:MAG: hypothetical protein ACM3VW_01555 [Bacteroidota bacterium]